MYALAALVACLGLAGSAQAAFVPALGSPFATDSPTGPLAVGDSDRNGTLDVAAGHLQVLRSDGTGHLRPATRIASSGPVAALAVGDLTGEARADYAAVLDGAPDSVVVYSDGFGGPYGAMTVDPAIGDADGIAIADLDRDGLRDIVVVHGGGSDEVTTLLNRGISYSRDDQSAGGDLAGSLDVGDFDGDGWPDVAAGTEGGEVALLSNNRDGTLEPGQDTATGGPGQARSVAFGDFDGDGDRDVAATTHAGVALLRGDGDGNLAPFGPPRPTGAGAPTDLAVGDVNGDGRTDVAAAVSGARVAILLGNGAGGLSGAAGSPNGVGAPTGAAVDQVELADMNRDGQLDFVTGNRTGTVSVRLNADTGFLQPQPTTVDFGQMPARSLPQTRTVTLRATRGRIAITRLDFQGSRRFSVGAGNCVGRTLLLGQSCNVRVTFTPPRRAGRVEALFSLDANAPAMVVPLVATPRPPAIDRLRLRPRPARPGRRMLLRYRLSEAARVRTYLQVALPGRRVRGRCVALTQANAERRRCARWQTLATTYTARKPAGANLLRLRARAGGGAPLAPGRYRLSVSAADRFRNRSEERFVKFRVADAAGQR
jgi:hypothetical protein